MAGGGQGEEGGGEIDPLMTTATGRVIYAGEARRDLSKVFAFAAGLRGFDGKVLNSLHGLVSTI